MTDKQKYRAMITDAQDHEFDWGFYDLVVQASGAIAMRCADWTPIMTYDTYIAPGEWKYIDTILPRRR